MIINDAVKSEGADTENNAWSGLRVFRNVEHTLAAIMQTHGLSDQHRVHARKQADQIRQCLIQAEEYAKAAETVSSATRPVLQYYSIVSLATAEILFKGTGDLSLDRAREQHGHHGLTLSAQLSKGGTVEASKLIATPAIFGGQRKGTFHLWHEVSRPTPTCGPVDRNLAKGQLLQYALAALMVSEDVPLTALPEQGHTLLQCFQHIPGLRTHLANFDVAPLWARCHVMRTVYDEEGRYETVVNFHPAAPDILDKIYAKVTATPPESLTHIEYPSGRRYTFKRTNKSDDLLEAPNGIHIGNDTYMWPYSDDELSLNYFGWLYLASFILGTFARYYPDKWMQDIERSSYVANAADAFYRIAAAHAPLATLSELSRVWMVPER